GLRAHIIQLADCVDRRPRVGIGVVLTGDGPEGVSRSHDVDRIGIWQFRRRGIVHVEVQEHSYSECEDDRPVSRHLTPCHWNNLLMTVRLMMGPPRPGTAPTNDPAPDLLWQKISRQPQSPRGRNAP